MTSRVLIKLLVLFAGVVLLGSAHCSRCDQSPLSVSFNIGEVSLIDNSGVWVQQSASDTLAAEAVAFSVWLSDSIVQYYATHQKSLHSFSFIQKALADECLPLFSPQTYVNQIEVITVYDINEEIPTGTSILNHFYMLGSGQLHNENLYFTPQQTLSIHQNSDVLHEPGYTFYFFLEPKVTHPNAQFQIIFELENGKTINVESPLIHIKDESGIR